MSRPSTVTTSAEKPTNGATLIKQIVRLGSKPPARSEGDECQPETLKIDTALNNVT